MSNLIRVKDLTEYGMKKCAKEFSEGSIELERCLITLWNHELYTKACCKGHLMGEKDFKFLYHYAYIAMEENIQLFKYLSDELIINPYILLYCFNNQECIYFYGDNKYKNIELLTRDILNGVKNNNELLNDKVNVPMMPSLKKKLIDDYYLECGFNKSEIKKLDELSHEYSLIESLFNNNELLERKGELLNEHSEIMNKVKKRVLKNKI